jgi:hypothetical protein
LRALFLYFFLLFIGIQQYAQNRGTLRGFVVDSLNGEVLPYANVLVKEFNRGATTDHRGYFIMTSLPTDQILTVEFSYMGYKSKRITIRIGQFQVSDIHMELAAKGVELETIEKIGERVNKESATDLSLQRITIRELENLPKGVELDVFRSLQSLPGVQSTGDVTSRFYVRGSPSNQNLVMLDNLPVYNPFHALGIFSAFDPEMVSSIEFFKGGFPTNYSGRLGSVLKVVTRDGNKNNFGGKASISLVTTKGLVEGPIPGGSFILSARKNYSDVILKKFRNDSALPADFYDIFFKVNYANNDLYKDAKFTFSIFNSNDQLINNDPLREDFKWSNTVYGLNYFQISDSPLFYQVEIGISKFKGERIANSSGTRSILNEIRDVVIAFDFSYLYLSKDELSGGFKISEVNNKLLLENYRGQSTDIGGHGVNISAYIQYKLLRFAFLGADVGSRINATRLAGGGARTSLEPRASFTVRFVPEFAFKASWGIFEQDLTTISDENEVVTVFEPWLITPNYLIPSTAIHYIGGFEYLPNKNLSINLEGYFKLMKDLAIVNERKYFSSQASLVPGNGESYGIELYSRFMNQHVNISASYSLAWAFKNVNGIRYAPRYDSRHTLNLSFEYDFGSGWSASAMWTYSSGLPFTQIAGYYEKLNLDNLESTNNMLDNFNPFIVLAGKNLGRLPDYHRLDLNLSKKFQLGSFKFYVDLSALNVYNRKNLFYFRRDTGERVDMLPFLPTATFKVEL